MQKLHNRKKNRLPEYDYSKPGYYYVTICTHNRIEWFGDINDGCMNLNDCGLVVKQQWEWLGNQYPYVTLDKYIIMPNHLHGIVLLNRPVRNGRDRSLPSKTLSSLIGAFKKTSSKILHSQGLNRFKWHKSFYDHIIRDDESLENIRHYIVNNPITWQDDEENTNKV